MDTQLKKDFHEEAMKYCVGLAYGDLRRTLMFKKVEIEDEKNKIENKKADFRNKMYRLIIDWIRKEIFSLNDPKSQFNDKHRAICEKIKTEATNSALFDQFYLGQAQKWLNMTLKNILLLNLCPDKMTDDLITSLHVPVDSIVIREAWELKDVEFPQIGLTRPKHKTGKDQGKPRYESVECWSRWDDYNDYLKFQKTLKTAADRLNKSPIEWEFYAWSAANQPDEQED